jgi:hypothetical protein
VDNRRGARHGRYFIAGFHAIRIHRFIGNAAARASTGPTRRPRAAARAAGAIAGSGSRASFAAACSIAASGPGVAADDRSGTAAEPDGRSAYASGHFVTRFAASNNAHQHGTHTAPSQLAA